MKYVLITPARNEEKLIAKTLSSMAAQTLPPERWIIVDDGSTDKTAEIVRSHQERIPWLRLVQRPSRADRSFAKKVRAFNAGYEQIGDVDYEIIGNMDADITFEPDYLEFLVQQFQLDPKLGVAGTPFLEEAYDSARDSFEGAHHVAGGCQMFRRTCFEEVGGYVPNPAGGVDWMAVATARMKGWRTRSFTEKRFYHHRTLGTAERSKFAASFSYGEKDYYLGGSPVWQLFRVAYRMTKKPIFLEGFALFLGYFSAALRRMDRPVSRELMHFHRVEQIARLKNICRALLHFKKVENFYSLRPEKNRP